MLFGWLDARQATEVGVTLADDFVSRTKHSVRPGRATKTDHDEPLRELLRRAEDQKITAPLNFFKKAKLANAFKWRLLERGIEEAFATKVTQTLVMHLSMGRVTHSPTQPSTSTIPPKPARKDPEKIFAVGVELMNRGDYSGAESAFRDVTAIRPRHALALNNLGAALSNLGRLKEAEQQFRRAIRLMPGHPDAFANLGALYRAQGELISSEEALRKAIKINPRHAAHRISLGSTLLARGLADDARKQFELALDLEPNNVGSLLGLGQVASMEGRLEDAELAFRRALELDTNISGALVGLIGLRKMQPSDADLLKQARLRSASNVTPLEEVNLRFAIGKFCDDLGSYKEAFENFKLGNELLKATREDYDPAAHTQFVDDIIRVYSQDVIAKLTQTSVSASSMPVFVVGMPRSGTSLVEQIIASHPDATGAGELPFWTEAIHRREAAIRKAPLNEETRRKLAAGYLRSLSKISPTSKRIVDKAPVNSDFLGVIHSVFPRARIIYMRRHPIDTCLSCYFQQFASSALHFTMDLDDLAHYYRQHHRLIAHWRSVLPAGTWLDVPYAELVANQNEWTRRILDFIGLDWNERVLEFHKTRRVVATASANQVRQKIYTHSVDRWRNYERYVGPLAALDALNW